MSNNHKSDRMRDIRIDEINASTVGFLCDNLNELIVECDSWQCRASAWKGVAIWSNICWVMALLALMMFGCAPLPERLEMAPAGPLLIRPILCTSPDSDFYPLDDLMRRTKFAEEVYERRLGIEINVLPLIRSGYEMFMDVGPAQYHGLLETSYHHLKDTHEIPIFYCRLLFGDFMEVLEGRSWIWSEKSAVIISSFATSDTVTAHELGHFLGLEHPWQNLSYPPLCPGPTGVYDDYCGSHVLPPCRFNVMTYCRDLPQSALDWDLTLSDGQVAVARKGLARRLGAWR